MFNYNEIQGNGKYHWSDGSTYDGHVSKGLRNGEGTFTSPDGEVYYKGYWKNG
jgi:hypothetical protein